MKKSNSKLQTASFLLRSLLTMFCVVVFLCTLSSGTAQAASQTKKKTMYAGSSATLRINGKVKKGKWKSSRKSVATVTNKGKVTARKKGTATISLQVGKKKYRYSLTVLQPVKQIKLNSSYLYIENKSDKKTLTAKIYTYKATYTYTNLNK